MKNAVTVMLASDLNPSTAGQEIVFTATVTPMSPGQPRVRGTVTFRDGTTFLGRRGLDHDSVARLEVSSLDAGTHTITADYSGSGTFAPAVSAALLETVNAAPPELAVSQSDAAMLSP